MINLSYEELHTYDIKDNQIVCGYINNQLSVWKKNNPKAAINVDFSSKKTQYRLKFGINKSYPLARAAGISKLAEPISVLDATVGLGKDAAILASLGFKVTMIERSEIIHALLDNGLKRAKECPEIAKITTNMSLLAATDAVTYMKALYDAKIIDENVCLPDVVYLDPMFPAREKSALVKKEMQFLQLLHGTTDDANDLLEPALAISKHRVVVKRPSKAKPLANKKPNYQLVNKTCRYDIYTTSR